jgi:hypothetical protein
VVALGVATERERRAMNRLPMPTASNASATAAISSGPTRPPRRRSRR